MYYWKSANISALNFRPSNWTILSHLWSVCTNLFWFSISALDANNDYPVTRAASPREEKTLAVARLNAEPRPTCVPSKSENEIWENKGVETHRSCAKADWSAWGPLSSQQAIADEKTCDEIEQICGVSPIEAWVRLADSGEEAVEEVHPLLRASPGELKHFPPAAGVQLGQELPHALLRRLCAFPVLECQLRPALVALLHPLLVDQPVRVDCLELASRAHHQLLSLLQLRQAQNGKGCNEATKQGRDKTRHSARREENLQRMEPAKSARLISVSIAGKK